MNLVFKELKDAGLLYIYIYLDDISIPSQDWEDMLSTLRRVFDTVRAAYLTFKPKNAISVQDN